MAKKSKATSFKNATICRRDGTITETSREEIRVYSLDNFLNDWDMVEGISISVRQDVDAAEDGEDS